MKDKTFLGYLRSNGQAGARNVVLILPINRSLNFIAANVEKMTRNTVHFDIPAETGRPAKDRETIFRTMVGLMHNPNVGGIVLMAVKHASGSSYKNMSIERYAAEAEKTGKPFSVVYLSDCGGSYAFLGETLRITREMVVKVSQFRRSICPLSALILGVKCGTSDATSGIAGNPCVGAVYDRVIKAGGTGFWSETTEIIGAEDIVAARAKTPEVGQKILEAARYWEEKAKSTGEDIRKINPIPANIAAGISTLEEKSLGAIAKGGTTEICGVLKYGERPPSHGLYFIDSWMSSLSLPLCFAASGAAIVLYQMGGGSFSENYPMMPAINPTVVSPFLYVTGNAKAYEKSPDNFDFNSSGIMLGTQTIEQAGELLLDHLLDIASGTFTKMEALNYAEQLEVFMEGPVL